MVGSENLKHVNVNEYVVVGPRTVGKMLMICSQVFSRVYSSIYLSIRSVTAFNNILQIKQIQLLLNNTCDLWFVLTSASMYFVCNCSVARIFHIFWIVPLLPLGRYSIFACALPLCLRPAFDWKTSYILDLTNATSATWKAGSFELYHWLHGMNLCFGSSRKTKIKIIIWLV